MPIIPGFSNPPQTGSLLRNAFALRELVKRRVPGYLDDDVLAAVNDAYGTVWDQITQLDDSYFTQVKIVTVAVQSQTFDFAFNEGNFLTAPLSNRFFQIDRLRVMQPGDTQFISARATTWNDEVFLSVQQLQPPAVSTTPPYMYIPTGRSSLYFGRPLPVGTQIEVVYSFAQLELAILSAGTISSAAKVVTGTATQFTTLLAPDFQNALPGQGVDYEVGAELIVAGQTYIVNTVTTDTNLTTQTAIAPAVTTLGYVLATVPDIPSAHVRLLADIATRNLFSTNAENAQQFEIWAALVDQKTHSMKDSVQERTRQNNPRVKRFQGGFHRRGIYAGGQ